MSSRSKLHSLREYSLFAAHINNCYRLAVSRNISFVFYWGGGAGGLLLGLLDKTQSESRKIERKMSDKCLESKRGTTAATMETQRGAKAPLVSSLSQDSLPPPHSKSPVLLPTGAGWANVVHLGSPRDTNTQMKEQPRKSPFSLSVSQQITLDSRLLRSSVLHRSAQFSFSCSGRLLSPPS